MKISAPQGALAGALLTAAVVAIVLRPAALMPHGAPSPAAVSTDEAPRAAVTPPHPAGVLVYVAGAVVRPGVYTLGSGARAGDAVARAGGLLPDADRIAVNLAAHVADGDEIAVPRIGEALAAPADRAPAGKRRRGASPKGRRRRDPPAPAEPAAAAVDINTADAATLATVPGVGETLAERIVEFRRISGPFASVDGLADVSGITPSRFDAIAPFLSVARP